MIELTVPQLERLERQLRDVPRQVPIVTARAINRSAEQARTQAGRSARESYHVKHKAILKTIKIRKAFPSDLTANIKSKGSTLELMKFKVRAHKPLPTRGKYTVVSVKKSSKKTIKGSFVATMKNGHTNVFTRVNKARKPIRGHYGPSIPQMLGNDNVTRAIEDKAMQVLDTRLEHEMSRILGR